MKQLSMIAPRCWHMGLTEKAENDSKRNNDKQVLAAKLDMSDIRSARSLCVCVRAPSIASSYATSELLRRSHPGCDCLWRTMIFKKLRAVHCWRHACMAPINLMCLPAASLYRGLLYFQSIAPVCPVRVWLQKHTVIESALQLLTVTNAFMPKGL